MIYDSSEMSVKTLDISCLKCRAQFEFLTRELQL